MYGPDPTDVADGDSDACGNGERGRDDDDDMMRIS